MKMVVCHVDERMIKICDVFKIDDKTPVCLKKTVFRKTRKPVLHVFDRVEIPKCSMHDDLSSLRLYGDDGRGGKCVDSLFCFNGDANGSVVV